MNMPQVISENTYQAENDWFLDLEVHTIRGLTDSVVRELNKNKLVSAKGFRPGKVPKNILERQIGQARLYVDAMVGQFDLLKTEKGYRTVAEPELLEMTTQVDGSIKFKVKVQLMPPYDVDESHYVNIEVEKKELTDKDKQEALDQHLQNLQKQLGATEPVDRPSEKGDEVTITFKGFINGKEEPLLSHKSMTIELGLGHLIEDIEAGLYGMHTDSKKTLEITFPSNHENEELREKSAQIEVEMESVKRFIPHPLDDDLAKQSNMGETLEELKSKFLETHVQRRTVELNKEFEQACLRKVVSNVNLPVPDSLLKNEMRGIINYRTDMLQKFNFPPAQIKKILGETDIEQLKQEAANRVSIAFIFDKLLEKGRYSLDDVSEDELSSLKTEKPDEDEKMLKKEILYKRFVQSVVDNAIPKNPDDTQTQ